MDKLTLITKIEAQAGRAIEHTYRALEAFPWGERRAYAHWLAQSYYYVSHTTRLLALAAGRLGPKESYMHGQFVGHLAEERGHEKLCVNDLKALGFKPDDFRELPQTSCLYYSIYYLIEHTHASSILGYAMVLEGVSAAKGDMLVKMLDDLYGKPATGFLRLHAHVDKEHTAGNRPMLEACTVTQLETISHAVSLVEAQYESMLNAIVADLKVLPLSERGQERGSFKKAA
ncbi:MAG TPA: iron-containing redox enzyme family protein [Bdellovibrionales bacterium]|nr:iron-containing redox enzyme family protein [Bdellovibrionales bacterium]